MIMMTVPHKGCLGTGSAEALRIADHGVRTQPEIPFDNPSAPVLGNNFHLIGHDGAGNIVLHRKLSRSQVIVRLANLPPCLIGMEACVGAHHLSRQLQALGHDARLMPAQYVKPYIRGQKNDFRDAEAIAEAVQRPRMRFVPTKSVEQLDLEREGETERCHRAPPRLYY